MALSLWAVVFRVDLTPRVESEFFFSTEDPAFQASRRISELFPSAPQLILSARGLDATSPEYLERVRELSEALLADRHRTRIGCGEADVDVVGAPAILVAQGQIGEGRALEEELRAGREPLEREVRHVRRVHQPRAVHVGVEDLVVGGRLVQLEKLVVIELADPGQQIGEAAAVLRGLERHRAPLQTGDNPVGELPQEIRIEERVAQQICHR